MDCRRLVVKCGTSTLTGGTAHLAPPRLVEIAQQVAQLRAATLEVIVVTSGAMAAGRERLSLTQLPKDLPVKQMLSAIGQPRLMALYEQIFGLYGLTIAQVLLTRADLADRRRYLNSRNTLTALLEHGIIPIVNENDTVATEEIRVGDNDNLSALVANLDRRRSAGAADRSGRPVHRRSRTRPDRATGHRRDRARHSRGALAGRGRNGQRPGHRRHDHQTAGRRSGAALRHDGRHRQRQRTECADAPGSGEKLGTWFQPVVTSIESRKRYILAGGRAAGSISVDDGAAQALRHGSSLLPVGVTGVEGTFERGDTIQVLNAAGREIARGMANYDSDDLARMCGRQSI